jgi:hypothetical protein
MSDGLQRLALDLARGRPYPPFFRPMFAALRDQDPDSLLGPLVEFLSSPRVNARTDDDKTLTLSRRRAHPQ